MLTSEFIFIISLIFYLFGVLAAIEAIFLTRSSQGAVAWLFALLVLPIISLPIYLIFGRPKLRGYKKLKHKFSSTVGKSQSVRRFESATPTKLLINALENLTQTTFTIGNKVQIFTSGETFFHSLLADINSAKISISLSFYMVRSDEIGKKIKNALINAVKRDVKVRFIYDQFGSIEIGSDFIKEMLDSGIEIKEFHTRTEFFNLTAMNCRNHRKIAVFDGIYAYSGGFNLGDEYLGGTKYLGKWRDTQIRIEGPEAIKIEQIFLHDWKWASGQTIELSQVNHQDHHQSDQDLDSTKMITIATGCADERDECILFLLSLINTATTRLWISVPYFVPDDSIIQAINLAAVRGVDVRLLVPNKSDNIFTSLAAEYYYPVVSACGVKIYKYNLGFMHQKVLLVDNEISVIGSANFDNRSLRLSFEIMTVILCNNFAHKLNTILENDFIGSTDMGTMRFEDLTISKQIASNVCRLFSPVL